jgi:hypothetical protein
MQSGCLHQVDQEDGLEGWPESCHNIVRVSFRSIFRCSSWLITCMVSRCDSGNRHYSKVSSSKVVFYIRSDGQLDSISYSFGK